MLLTDWLFLESPAVLALSALISALESRIDLEELITSIIDRYGGGRGVGELVAVAGEIRRDVQAAIARVAAQEGHFRSAIKKVMGIHKRLYRSRTGDAGQPAENAER